MRTLIFTLALVLTLGLSAVQAASVKTHLPGDLTLEEAQDILTAALAKAKEVAVPMNIAVVDAGGNLKIFARQDGAFLGSIDIAQK